ncbi:hypothetical protein [Prauserella alba]|uniref:MmyB family transcriptional regulator n=1 Tax=Prauserella alba TaxID=176898 RepID=UPI0020A55EDB|nr:hypothetical protein [Prauserella alba]
MSTGTGDRRNRSRGQDAPRLRAGLRSALAAVADMPAIVVSNQLDVVATNALGRALLAPALGEGRSNLARFVFLDENTSTAFYPEWDRIADEHVDWLRATAAQARRDRALHRLIGELSTVSPPFRTRWSSERLRACYPPRVTVDHPLVGELDLIREDLMPVADPVLTLRVYTAEPGTATAERLSILASWIQDSALDDRADTKPA